jgi:hypothetical protein
LAAGSLLAAADLRADLELLRRIFDALHPGQARYLTAAARDAAWAELMTELGRDRPLGEVFLALTAFTAKLRCGHTYPSFFNQRAAIARALFEGPRLPFLFRWMDGAMVVTDSLIAEPRLARGVEVVRLAGVPTSELLARLLPLARADGSNDAKRAAYLEVRGGAYEAFELLVPLLVPGALTAPEGIALEVRRADGAIEKLTVPPQTLAERRAVAAAREPDTSDPQRALWALELRPDGIGYLRMPTWVVYKTKWDWRGDLERAMRTLVSRRARALIIDLRGNEGGNDVGNELLRYVVRRPVPLPAHERRTRYRVVPEDLRPHLDTWDTSFFDRGAAARDLGDGWFVLEDRPGEAIEPRAPRFAGRVIVLVDASNSSATFQFARLVQERKLATLIGEPTGGNLRGINGGSFFFVRLPRTGIEIDLPLVGVFAPTGASEPPDRGLIPDRVVRTTAADLRAGRDPQLAAAIALATQR